MKGKKFTQTLIVVTLQDTNDKEKPTKLPGQTNDQKVK
jgi:hypothetical protein